MAPYGNQNSKGKGITTASSDPEGGPSKRTLQNRKAQREFRKRREARVRELEDRCRRYDELGLEANVEIQRVARRLKDENDALRNLLISLGHGKLIPSALEGDYQQIQTSSAGAGHSSASLISMSDAHKADTVGDPTGLVASTSSSSSSSTATKQNRSNSIATSSSSSHSAMGPPMQTSSSQRGVPLLPSGVQYSTSAQSNESSSRGEDTESNAYNPPELLQRSALSNASLLSKLGNSMGGMPASSSADEHCTSALMAQHINAAINNSMQQAVPSLLRLDLPGPNGERSLAPAQPGQQQEIKVKEEGFNGLSGMRLGPFGSMGLSMPSTSNSASAVSGSAYNGPIVSYSGSMNPSYLPFVQPTSVNEALLNPNPIPFQFNLSQLSQPPVGFSPMHSFSTLADQGAWWLSGGGSQLTPGQDPNALDEKAQMVAAEQQRQQQQQQQQQQQHELVRSASGSQSNDGQQFDLSAFLNGGVTPGGSFKMDGNTAISGQQSSNHSNSSTHNSPRRDSGSTPLGADLRGLDPWEALQNNSNSKNGNQDGSDGAKARRNTVAGTAVPSDSESTGRRPSMSAVSETAKPSTASDVIDLTSSPALFSPSPLGAAPSPPSQTTSPSKTTTSLPPVRTTANTTTSTTDGMPAVNTAKQLLLDGAGPMPPTSSGGAMAMLGGEGYPSMTIPLKRTLSNALLGSGPQAFYGDGSSMNPSAFASLPPTKIFRAAAPGAAGAVPSGLDNAESTRAFLQLLERRMAKADGGLGPAGLYEHLGFRPPSFVAAGAGAGAASSSSPTAAAAASSEQQQQGDSVDGALMQQQQQVSGLQMGSFEL